MKKNNWLKTPVSVIVNTSTDFCDITYTRIYMYMHVDLSEPNI